MRCLRGLVVCIAMVAGLDVAAQIYELRTYTAAEGKLDAMHARFRDHTIDLFARHGIESIAYWSPTDAPASENTLIYLLKHPSREAATANWAAFGADPEWQEALEASEADGRILARVPASVFLSPTDYSPDWSEAAEGTTPVYELRTYTTNTDKLDDLHARFRNHTDGLFAKHGMVSLAYWTPDKGRRAKTMLFYILRHESRDAASESWKAFLADPEWRAVYQASEADGAILKAMPDSVFMIPTAYSPTR